MSAKSKDKNGEAKQESSVREGMEQSLLSSRGRREKHVSQQKYPLDYPDLIENGYLKWLGFRNFFCIDKLTIEDLEDKKEIYIVGENGDGKTILLQAILLALKGDRNVGEFVNFLKQNPRKPYRLEAKDHNCKIFRFDEIRPYREFIANNVFAYGVHRSRNDSDKTDPYGCLTLFEEDRYLGNPVKWLQYLHHKETAGEKPPIALKTAVSMLKALLNENVDIEVSPDAVIFTERGNPVKFSQLADGYKSVIIWTCDLLERLSKNQPGTEHIADFKGIVLLDEIELYLHPKWKYQIVRKLRQWFANIQFIFTTHSSTVILGASKDAVFYKLYKEDGLTRISQPVSRVSHLMLNSIVTSPLFDMESARASAFEEDVPGEISAADFEDQLLKQVTAEEDRTFLLSVYKKPRGKNKTVYVLKKDLDKTSLERLHRLLIAGGLKEPPDTGDDFLYHKIHREIEKRLKGMKHVTEARILDMVRQELDAHEENRK